MARSKYMLVTGTLYKPESYVCETCLLPSVLEGIIYELMWKSGVRPWGTLRGCNNCQTWFSIDLDGKLERVNFRINNGGEREDGQQS